MKYRIGRTTRRGHHKPRWPAVIGHVPVLPAKYPEGENIDLALAKLDPRICTAMNKKGSRSEAFRSIRTAIYFNNQSATNQVLQITSSTPGEGKSTIAANLAVSIAQSGRSVILLDADLRRPRVHSLFGTESAKGVAWSIEQVAKLGSKASLALSEAVLETGVPNLSLMVAGDRPDNPAELLSSVAFQTLIDMLRQKFDMVLIDSPPLLAVSDPSNVVRRADGVLMVVRLRKNAKPLVARACRMLESLEANVLGVVVNGVGSRQARGYGKDAYAGLYYSYGYGYSYGSETGAYAEYHDESQPQGEFEIEASQVQSEFEWNAGRCRERKFSYKVIFSHYSSGATSPRRGEGSKRVLNFDVEVDHNPTRKFSSCIDCVLAGQRPSNLHSPSQRAGDLLQGSLGQGSDPLLGNVSKENQLSGR